MSLIIPRTQKKHPTPWRIGWFMLCVPVVRVGLLN